MNLLKQCLTTLKTITTGINMIIKSPFWHILQREIAERKKNKK
jgi:hypothetical protein